MNKPKSDESNGNLGFDNDHLLICTPKLVAMLSVSFNVMIIPCHNANVNRAPKCLFGHHRVQ